jgi:serine protease inhibitor
MPGIRIAGCLCMLLVIVMTAALVQTTRRQRELEEAQELKAKVFPAVEAYSPGPYGSNAHVVYDPVQRRRAEAVATAANIFGLKLLADVASHNRHENVFLSPLSVFSALAMAESGAAGETRSAMRKTLSVPASLSMREGALGEAGSTLLKTLQSQQGIELSIANALWSDTKMPLSPGFVQRCHNSYEAEAATLDFSKPATADIINDWVKKKTQGKIANIVTPGMVSASQAILTNAVYFRGKWQYQFSKQETQEGTFHLANGGQKKVPLMHRSPLPGAYLRGNGFEAAVLPYQSSGIEMYAILPMPGKSPEEVLANISLEKLRSSFASDELDLRLPRFTLDFSAGLKDALTRMGMGPAFHPGADFAPMGSPGFYIGDVLHKTRLEVDEEGTVAAAATAVGVLSAAVPKIHKRTLVFDRPFAVLLCDSQTGAVLFAGVVYDPQP